jgi:hypothetical protein
MLDHIQQGHSKAERQYIAATLPSMALAVSQQEFSAVVTASGADPEARLAELAEQTQMVTHVSELFRDLKF